MNAVNFGYDVLRQLGLNNWKVELTDGDEGFCRKASKTILFGRQAIHNKKLMLHEIAHALTNTYHYSDEFEGIVASLEKEYLS